MAQSPIVTHDRTVGGAYPVSLPAYEGPLDLLLPNDPPLPRVKTYPITVAEQINNMRDFLTHARQERHPTNGTPARPVTFIELLSRETSRVEVVVTFLAVLELIKQREVLVEQDDTFGEITLVLVAEADRSGVAEEG